MDSTIIGPPQTCLNFKPTKSDSKKFFSSNKIEPYFIVKLYIDRKIYKNFPIEKAKIDRVEKTQSIPATQVFTPTARIANIDIEIIGTIEIVGTIAILLGISKL